jgi:hypothetical protein
LLLATIGLALLAAASARAAEVTAEQRAAYLACYRSVLAAPVFARMESAELYRIREEGLARTVITACRDEIEPYGRELLENALRALDSTTPRPKDWLFTLYEGGLRKRVAMDLVEVAPRVMPIADAEATRAPAAAEQ